ncbi:MAG: glucan biosynthesis protein G [Stenotrophobium sp.]
MIFRLHRAVACCTLLLTAMAAVPAQAFDFNTVASQAQALSNKPYKRADDKLPRELLDLSLDDYHNIRYKPQKALWHSAKLPFELQFFHPGAYYDQTVQINVVDDGRVHPLTLDPDDFDYGNNHLDKSKLRGIGYAGFRVHYALNTQKYKDELIEFQGASYFRGLGKGQHYGLSARGLAIDTGLLSGEEFPAFTDFWIVKPGHHDRQLVIYALLNSPRATGAYRFVVKPGESTIVDVQARLFLRSSVGKLGLAPLTSMFLFGENQPSAPDFHQDYRPEVHDSDGLQVDTGREWLWRPLVNPKRLLITSFGAINPRGFGLMQRDRDFHDYEDLDARYDLRPSAWIAPKGNWGAGRIELVEIPTPDETNDNIVAYWVPEKLPAPHQPLDLAYTLSWEMDKPTRPPDAWVAQSLRGQGYQKDPDGSIRFTLDFVGPALSKLPADAPVISGVWLDDNAQLIERQVLHNDVTRGWRVTIRFKRLDDDKPVEMRAFLSKDKKPISETWSYILPAQSQTKDAP